MESTRTMTRERGSPGDSKNCEILLLPTADRRFDMKVKCPGIAPGGGEWGMGGFGIDWYIRCTRTDAFVKNRNIFSNLSALVSQTL